jgi:hypothetical protein
LGKNIKSFTVGNSIHVRLEKDNESLKVKL